MKKGYLLAILFILASLGTFGQWGHRYVPEQANQNITTETSTSFTVSVEWGEGDWTNSEFGYGTTTDGSGWTWTSLPWFENGVDNNKRCKTNITISTSGVYYYAYRFLKGGSTTYQHGSEDWSENANTLSGLSTITASSTKTWTGTTDTDWSTDSNWTPTGTPIFLDNVIIPVVTNQPTITSAVTVNQATIASGASLISNSTFTGTVSYNINVTDDKWHLISSPIVGQVYNDTWANTNSIADGTGTNRGISTYQNGALDATTGPWVYMLDGGNGTFGSGTGYSLKRTALGNYTFTGTFPSGDITPTISQNVNNWNLIGNPYPSYIDISNFITVNSANLSAGYQAVYVWNASTGTYDGLTTGYIHPCQAFFINSNIANGTASITETMQSHQTGITFYKNSNTSIKLKISDGTNVKNTIVNYLDGKTTSLDPGFDIGMFNGVSSKLRIYTHLIENNEGISFKRQALPKTNFETMIIPIGVKASVNEEITFTTEILNLPKGLKVFLEDKIANTFTRLDETNSEYKITLTGALNDVGRFFLHTKQSILDVKKVTLSSVSIFDTGTSSIKITGLPQGKTTVSLTNVLGKQVMTTYFNANGIVEISLPQLATGIYFAKIKTETGKISKKIILE